MSNTLSAETKWKAVVICFLNIVSAIEFGGYVCIDAELKTLMSYGRIYYNWGAISGVVKLQKHYFAT